MLYDEKVMSLLKAAHLANGGLEQAYLMLNFSGQQINFSGCPLMAASVAWHAETGRVPKKRFLSFKPFFKIPELVYHSTVHN